jgi:hypothetical protein
MVGTISGDTAQLGVRRTIFSDTVCTDTVSAVSSNAVCTDTISTVSGNAVCTDTISTVSGYAVCTDAVSAVSSYAVCTDAVSTISSDTVCTDTISTVSSNTINVGVGRAVFSDNRCVQPLAGINSGSGKSACCQYREGQAKDQFVGFHEGCSSTFNEWVIRYGADVTRRKNNQNSLRLVANIVGIDS